VQLAIVTLPASSSHPPEVASLSPATLTLGSTSSRVPAPEVADRVREVLHLPSELLRFRAELVNTSEQPVWYWAHTPDVPFFGTAVRAAGSSVTPEHTGAWCGNGAALHELAPGTSAAFTACTSPDNVGSWLSIALSVYLDAAGRQPPIRLRSQEVRIQ
jgi:hypothetical protein